VHDGRVRGNWCEEDELLPSPDSETKHLQYELNRFIADHKSLGYVQLQVDGETGQRTKQVLHNIRYDLGYLRENLDKPVDDNFFKRLRHPNQVEPRWGQTKDVIRRGKKRRRVRRRWVARNRTRAFLKPGVGSFDGIAVAKCAIPVLTWCRQHGWRGRLVSGYRTPAYSESLCRRMCGRPTCPGRCAGRSTNHAYATPERFAMDVSDYIKFAEVVRNCPVRPHVHNSLPNDRVHFSPSGN
jgi:hypothetical protein